jgi:putative membrane protein
MIAHFAFDPHAIWSQWSFVRFEYVPALFALGLYGVGLYATGIRAVSRARALCFGSGVLIALGSVVSPLHSAAEAMFSMHMIQHQVLMLVAAPLLVAGRPGLVMALAFPMGLRRWTWAVGRARPSKMVLRVLRNPLVVLLVYAGVLWMWHLPGPYQAAVRSGTVHALEHLAFLAISLAFWAGVVRTGPRRRMRYVPAIGLVLGTMLLTGWLAAVLTFGNLIYPLYAQRAALLGLNASVDQELAGTIMWVPSTLIYFVVFAVLFVRWFRELDARFAPTPAVVREP